MFLRQLLCSIETTSSRLCCVQCLDQRGDVNSLLVVCKFSQKNLVLQINCQCSFHHRHSVQKLWQVCRKKVILRKTCGLLTPIGSKNLKFYQNYYLTSKQPFKVGILNSTFMSGIKKWGMRWLRNNLSSRLTKWEHIMSKRNNFGFNDWRFQFRA